MFLVRGSVTALAAQVAGNRLVPRLIEQFRFRFGYNPSQSEVRSWDRSIPALLGRFLLRRPVPGVSPSGGSRPRC